MTILLILASILLHQETGRSAFGSISGRVRAADGSPASGVRIAAMSVDETGTGNTADATLASLGQTDSQGRYLLENVPPGRYFIMAGYVDSPSFYPGAGTTAEAGIISVAAREAVANMDFILVRSIGERVRGTVRNLPRSAPPGILRVAMLSINRPVPFILEAIVNSDGTFEFQKVPPGSHYARLTPGPPQTVRVDVVDKDIDSVELIAPPMVLGRVTVDDGGALPVQAAAIAAAVPDPPALFRLQASRPGFPGTTGTATVRGDGLFVLPLAPESGPHSITVGLMPMGYFLKSIRYGTTDLLQSSLELDTESATEIQAILTRTPPAGTPIGVRVTGRVTALENSLPGVPVVVTLQSRPPASAGNPVVIRVGEAIVEKDGTFEITRVPPGSYSLRTIPLSVQSTNVVDVADADITGLELTLRSPAAPVWNVLPSSPPPPPAPTVQQPPMPRPGRATLSVSQSGRGPGYVEGAVSFFRVEQSGKVIEELRLDRGPTVFTLPPGNYELRSFVRPCTGDCSRLDPPRDSCTAPFTAVAAQILFAERVMQGASCTIQFKNPEADR